MASLTKSLTKGKKVVSLLSILLLFLHVGCGEDDKESDPEEDSMPTLNDAAGTNSNNPGATSTTPPTGKGDIVLNGLAYKYDDGDSIADFDLTSLALSITSVVVSSDGTSWTTIWNKLEGEELDVITGSGSILIKGVPVGSYPYVYLEFGDQIDFQRSGDSCTAQEDISYYGTDLLFATTSEAAEFNFSFEAPYFGTYDDSLDDIVPNTNLSRGDYLWYLQNSVNVTEAGTTNLYLGFETGGHVSASTCDSSSISYTSLALGTTSAVGDDLADITNSEDELTGIFTTSCASDSNGAYFRSSLLFSASGSFTKTYSTYSDSACATNTWSTYEYFYYRIGEDSSIVSGATDLDLLFYASTIYLADSSVASDFNTSSICGKTDWAEGYLSTSSGVSDGNANCPVRDLSAGSIYYDLYSLNGDSLQLGLEEAGRGATADTRLQSIDTSVTYSK